MFGDFFERSRGKLEPYGETDGGKQIDENLTLLMDTKFVERYDWKVVVTVTTITSAGEIESARVWNYEVARAQPRLNEMRVNVIIRF